ncbi:DUF427 domain-containing protein [Mycobacterium tilburgii]|uniref:DUF427 domain-containing protein n=1 Tax=Mycobacterium tilburgii TaxID=44467 RepID=UPI003898E965
MTAQVQSAWPDHPEYRIEATPCPYTGQVWFRDVLVAESDHCLVVTETDHDDRLYFPRIRCAVGPLRAVGLQHGVSLQGPSKLLGVD